MTMLTIPVPLRLFAWDNAHMLYAPKPKSLRTYDKTEMEKIQFWVYSHKTGKYKNFRFDMFSIVAKQDMYFMETDIDGDIILDGLCIDFTHDPEQFRQFSSRNVLFQGMTIQTIIDEWETL